MLEDFRSEWTHDGVGNSAMKTEVSGGDFAVNPLALDLDTALNQLDSGTAALLERTVRDALALAKRRTEHGEATDALGYPVGYFETTSGSFAGEPLDAPRELPLEIREAW